MRNLHFYLFFTVALLLSLCSIQKVTAQPRIYEIYSAGNVSGATWGADYLVLSGFTANQSLSGYYIQYRGGAASPNDFWTVFALAGNADATGFYRLKCAGTGAAPWTPDHTITLQMTNTGSSSALKGAQVALTTVSTAFSIGTCPSSANYADLVGYIGINAITSALYPPYCFEGTGGAVETSNSGTQSRRRKTATNSNGQDTNNNANDFEIINAPYTSTCTAPSIITAASSNTPICSGATLNLSVTASGTAPLSYSWTGTGTFTNGTTATPSVTGAATGNYTATVYNACGNVTSIAPVVVNPSVGTPGFMTGATTLCAGGTSTYTATATNSTGITYSIQGGTGATIDPNSGVVSNVTGNFTVIASAAGCGGPTTVSQAVTVNPNVGNPSFTSGATTLCEGGTSTYTATAANSTGITYSIVGGTGATIDQNSGVVSSVTGNFTVRATAAGCGGPLTVDQAVAVTPVVGPTSFTAGATALCVGGTSTYQATATNSTGITYSIFTGGASINATTGVVSNVVSNFTVRATATGTCGNTTADRSVTVNIPSATASITTGGGILANPTATGQTNKLFTGCQGDNIVLTAGTSGASSHKWFRNGTQVGNTSDATFTVNAGWGDYQLIAYDASGCGQATDTVGISLKPTPLATGGLDRNICQGTTTTIGAAAQANTTYTWTPNDGHLSSFSASNPTVLATLPNSTTYNLQITRSYTLLDANFTCTSAMDPVMVTLLPQPAAPTIAASATEVCQGTTITLTASNIVGSSRWFINNVVSVSTNPLNVMNTSGVAKAYTAKNLGANGCYSLASNSVNVTIQNAPSPTITSSVGTDVSNIIKVCPGITNATLTANVTGGTPTYTWFSPPNVTSLGSGDTLALTNIATTNKSYYVKATYVYGGLTCTKNSVTKTIRQDATATNCRLMQNEEETFENALSAYPNPTEKLLNAKIQVVEAGEATLTLINSLGQNIWTEKRNLEEGDTDIQLSLETLPAGIYILSLEKENVHQSVKIIKE